MLCALLAGLVAGCAPRQWITLDLGPDPPRVWVDGAEHAAAADGLELRADRDHTLYFKQPGHRPRLVVVESVEGAEGPELRPDLVRVRLLPIARGGTEVEVEIERAPSDRE